MQNLSTALHRWLWPRLPRRARREVMLRATKLAAPRPRPVERPATPIVIAGMFRTASGLGQSARLCRESLKRGEIPILNADLTDALMQPSDAGEPVGCLKDSLRGPGTLMLHVNAPIVPLAMCHLGRSIVHGKYVVGYWAWELPRLPSEWKHGLPFVHEIWVPSRFVAKAVEPIADGRPVRVVPHPVAVCRRKSVRAPVAGRPFTVLTIFNAASSFTRKNPLGSIAAFRQAFGDDPSVRLIVKASHLSVYPTGCRLLKDAIQSSTNAVLIDHTTSRQDIDELYQQSDVFMSLHRSEGFGLTIAEAMARGLPVIATAWSGNTDFLSAETGIPIPHRMIPAEDPQSTYHYPDMQWADPDIEAAAEALRLLRRHPERGTGLGKRAAEFIESHLNHAAYATLVRKHLGV